MIRRGTTYTAWILGFLLSVAGVILIYSASRRIYGYELFLKQIIWLTLGITIAILITRLERQHIYRSAWGLYLLGVCLLVTTFFFGTKIRGDQSWLDLGLFQLQSSELMKFFLILAWARLGRTASRGERSRLRTLFYSVILFLIPLTLVLLQPDLGTALVYFGLFGGWLFIAGYWREGIVFALSLVGGVFGIFMELGQLDAGGEAVYSWLEMGIGGDPSYLLLFSIGLGIALLIFSYVIYRRLALVPGLIMVMISFLIGMQMVPMLEDYQLQRMRVYFNPYSAPLESGYNIIQAQIAIGSGGWLGQGYLEGSQSQLGFIPELWTDFIFSVAVEELGILFGFGLLLALSIYVYCFFSAASLSADWEGYYICSGMALIILIHSILNLGVCVGLVPVVGLPLPFLSYGGSFLVTNWILLGVLSVISRRLSGQALLKSPPASDRVRSKPRNTGW